MLALSLSWGFFEGGAEESDSVCSGKGQYFGEGGSCLEKKRKLYVLNLFIENYLELI